MSNKYKLKSQISENQVEADVANYLGFITPLLSNRYRLISVDEQQTGADKLFDRFSPIYMQFKVSQGLNPKNNIWTHFQNKPLTKIINYRKQNGLTGDPILYFELREKAKNAKEFQHNLLRKLHRPPKQFAMYVAPLTLDLAEYERAFNPKWFYRFFYWNFPPQKMVVIDDTIQQQKIQLGMNPFLRCHISIPPHVNVDTHEHHYSFSKSGGDVAWHGGQTLNDDFRLSSQFARILEHFYANPDYGFSLRQYSAFIRELTFIDPGIFEDLSAKEQYDSNRAFSDIYAFARFLKVEYNIRLLFLTEHS